MRISTEPLSAAGVKPQLAGLLDKFYTPNRANNMIKNESINYSLDDCFGHHPNAHQSELLLKLVDDALHYAVKFRQPLPVELKDHPDFLRAPGASFVTLLKDGELRGCIGSLQAHRPLALDIVGNAFSASQHDPRFTPVLEEELPLEIHLSLLSKLVELNLSGEQELLNLLVPYQDGLVIEAGEHRATFLPQVWEQLPEKRQFLSELKRKAGIATNYWGTDFRAWRYRVTELICGASRT